MSAFALKMIAVITMFIDHFGVTFSYAFDTSICRLIGRMAFPLYVFLIAQGCHHTRSMEKYLFRLGIFAVISEIPFDLLVANTLYGSDSGVVWYYPGYQNVFFTLFFGVLAVYLFENMKKGTNAEMIVNGIGVALAIAAGWLLKTDYGTAGILAIFLCSCFKRKRRQMFVIMALIAWECANKLLMFSNLMLLSYCCSLVWIYFYNGREGPKAKWFFYGFYPIHLLVLFSLYYIDHLISTGK